MQRLTITMLTCLLTVTDKPTVHGRNLELKVSSHNFSSIQNYSNHFDINTNRYIFPTIKNADIHIPFGQSEQEGHNNIRSTNARSEADNVRRQKALTHLMQMFDVVNVSRSAPSGSVPEFMTALYQMAANSNGVAQANNPYDAHLIRSFVESRSSAQEYFHFQISGVKESEILLEAELRIHVIEIHQEFPLESANSSLPTVFKLFDMSGLENTDASVFQNFFGVNHSFEVGWVAFNITQTIKTRMNVQSSFSFLVVATTTDGRRVSAKFSRRGQRGNSKQPILVMFNQDLQQLNPGLNKNKSLVKHSLAELKVDNLSDARLKLSVLERVGFDKIFRNNSKVAYRLRRSRNETENGTNIEVISSCSKQDSFVSFDSIGWSSWIISPKVYNAFSCRGPCNFPLGLDMKPSNHATVQSIVHELKLDAGVERLCCVPNTFLPISLLYYDDHDNVVLKQYHDMVVESCGCT